jgi:hypothetical protein
VVPDENPAADGAEAFTDGAPLPSWVLGDDNMTMPYGEAYAHEAGHDFSGGRHFMHPYTGGPPTDPMGDWNLLRNLMRPASEVFISLRQASNVNDWLP